MAEATSRTAGPDRQKLAAFGLVAVILILVGGSILWASVRETTPDSDSAEAGFLRDMQVHHEQAVVMAMIIRDRTDDEQIHAMATDIAFAQSRQIGLMSGFIHLWDINPTGDGVFMSWMGHSTTGLMPGMATEEEIDRLETLPVDEAETLFLQLMNRHHIAGVEMAQAILERTDQDDVEWLAESMVRVQTAEIDVMNQMLEERGAEPVTSSNVTFETSGPQATPDATPAEDDHEH